MPAAGLVTTVRAPLAEPLIYEGSLGLGYTPTHGDLEPYQQTTFVSGSSGLRWRFWGRQSLYGICSITARTTTTRRSTRSTGGTCRSISAGCWRRRSGKEWRIGMTEDLEPSGPAIDLVFRLGVAR